jgi:putative sigma-54 modulation protein
MDGDITMDGAPLGGYAPYLKRGWALHDIKGTDMGVPGIGFEFPALSKKGATKRMKVIITSKSLNASDHLKDTIESKFRKLGKFFSDEINANIMLSLEKGRQKIEATINAKGTIFRAEETTNDIYNGVDRVVDKLAAQMSKFKTKLQRKHKDNKAIQFSDVPDPIEEDQDELALVRRKKFDLLPMSADEAILQMELLEHNFFVFLNMETDSVGVVYKRKDGNYGLLETEY